MGGAEEEEDLDELVSELKNDEYPKPEEREEYPLPEKKEVTYKNVDVTIKFKKESEKDSETDEKRTLFTDAGFGLSALEYDEDKEVLRVPIVLAKEMVYVYGDYNAFRPKEELEAIASYMKGVPVTRGHPEAKIVTDREEVRGWAVDATFEDDELKVVLEISDKELIEDIKSGKLRGVSPGHFSMLDRAASGEFEGAHYDVTQRDIFIDHIAIVEEGRCSTADGCGIALDAKQEDNKDKEKKEEGDEEKIMEPKVIEKKVDAAMNVAETIEKKANEEAEVLKEIAGIKDVPSAVVSKVKKAIGIAEKISEEVKSKLKDKLEGVKKAVGETEEPEEPEKVTDEVMTDEAVTKLGKERDELRSALDSIVGAEKERLVDELKSLQDVKSEDTLKEMSLDSLKSDLELVKAMRDSKVTFGDKDESAGGTIKSAYQGVGRKGGKE